MSSASKSDCCIAGTRYSRFSARAHVGDPPITERTLALTEDGGLRPVTMGTTEGSKVPSWSLCTLEEGFNRLPGTARMVGASGARTRRVGVRETPSHLHES